MASLIRDPDGSYRVEVVIPNGSRKRVRLGKMPTKTAQSWHRRVEALASDLAAGEAHTRDLAAWLVELPEKLHERLVRAGLARPRAEREAVTLGALVQSFKDRASVKASTFVNYRQTLDSIVEHFGLDRDIASITPPDADDWRKAISTSRQSEGPRKRKRLAADGRLSPASVSKRIRVAKLLFGKAAAWGLIDRNPFSSLKAGSQSNPARQRYIPAETIETVLAAAPSVGWRTLIGLCRYGGVRCPSELEGMLWTDVAWDTGTLTVRSPKTEHHGSEHAIRFVPISPRLREILREAWEAAPDDGTATHVVPLASDPATNLRTQFQRIVTRAGCVAWPRLFQALRASCEMQWVQERHPLHEVARWMGHSARIAAAHYLTAIESNFQAVVSGGQQRGAESGAVGDRQGVSGMDNRSGSDGEFLGEYVNPAVVNTCLVGQGSLNGSGGQSIEREKRDGSDLPLRRHTNTGYPGL